MIDILLFPQPEHSLVTAEHYTVLLMKKLQ